MKIMHTSRAAGCATRMINVLRQAAFTLLAMMITAPVYAQASDPISRLLTKAVDLLTNRWAVASAVVTIAVMGYRMKYGMLDKRNAFVTIFGIVIVFGAALLVDEIRG